MTLDEAVQHALDGNAILFLGAGFAFGAENIDKRKMPDGRALAGQLLGEIGYGEITSLDKASAAYLRRKSPRDLIRLLIPMYTASIVSDAHKAISALPFRRVYTTNYDNVYELARQQQGLHSSPVVGADDPRANLSKENLIVHINGSVARLDEESLGTLFKLTSESYSSDSFEQSGWAFHFRQDIRTAKAVIFVGYSMYDLDIRRTVFSEDISEKCFFVTGPARPETELDAEDLADLGVVAPIGVDAFGIQVRQIQASYEPQELDVLLDSWVQHTSPESASGIPSDQEVLDFLEQGEVSPQLAVEMLGPNRAQYVLDRPVLESVIGELIGGVSPVLIFGELGTGKTSLCSQVADAMAIRGVAVYSLERASDSEIGEASEICGLQSEKLLIVENYQRHLDLIKWISETKPPHTSLVLTARTNAHELHQQELYAYFGSQLRIHDISTLTGSEISGAAELLTRYGLWGDRAGLAFERKKSFVRHECSAHLPSLLVEIIKARHITERYQQLLASVSNKTDVEAVLICAFALDVMEFSPRIAHIQELLANSVDWAAVRSQPALRAAVNFDRNLIRAKSSVLGKHLLHEVFGARRVTEVLIGMVREADFRRSDKEFYQILNAAMRYGYVSQILPEESRLASTIAFYEGIKNLGSTRRNSQFWLQYAIACMAIGRLERADRYFKQAYEFCPPGYDTYQIDNHFARYLLERAIVVNEVSDGMQLVDKASKIVLAQMSSEVRKYPYRVAIGLFRFFDKFKRELGPSDKSSFKRMFAEIEKRAESAGPPLQSNRYVLDCLARSKEALAELAGR